MFIAIIFLYIKKPPKSWFKNKYPQLINYLFFVYIFCKLRILFIPFGGGGRRCGDSIVNFYFIFVFNFTSHCNENSYIRKPPKCGIFFAFGMGQSNGSFPKKKKKLELGKHLQLINMISQEVPTWMNLTKLIAIG